MKADININWDQIDTVLFDMDGTLLDLHFDNFFWLNHLPKRYAELHGICQKQATKDLHHQFNEKKGTLDWYCLEYWSNHLSVNIRQLKEEIKHLIQERPFVQEFLQQLKQHNKQRVLITNAHPQSLDLKLSVTGIEHELDQVYSSHQFGQPKESQQFWQALFQQAYFNQHQTFDPQRTLFIDDSIDVLHSAKQYGIGHLIGMEQPDSKQTPKKLDGYQSITHFNEIFPNQ